MLFPILDLCASLAYNRKHHRTEVTLCTALLLQWFFCVYSTEFCYPVCPNLLITVLEILGRCVGKNFLKPFIQSLKLSLSNLDSMNTMCTNDVLPRLNCLFHVTGQHCHF